MRKDGIKVLLMGLSLAMALNAQILLYGPHGLKIHFEGDRVVYKETFADVQKRHARRALVLCALAVIALIPRRTREKLSDKIYSGVMVLVVVFLAKEAIWRIVVL